MDRSHTFDCACGCETRMEIQVFPDGFNRIAEPGMMVSVSQQNQRQQASLLRGVDLLKLRGIIDDLLGGHPGERVAAHSPGREGE